MTPHTAAELAEMQAMAHRTGHIVELEQQVTAQAAEIARLREALERIGGVRGPYSYPFPEANPDYGTFAVIEARAALGAGK